MKVRNLMLFLFFAVTLVMTTGCGSNWLEFAADDSSDEACEYKASKDLNEGKWQDVIDASCAVSMQKGAAYFGKAGYDISDIIDRMISANESDSDSDVSTYFNQLIGNVSKLKLDDLAASVNQYSDVQISDADYDDAQFYINKFINPVKSLASIKGLIDSSGDGIDMSLDINNNGNPDEVDAASCALNYAAVGNCNGIDDVDDDATTGLDFSEYGYSNTYTGLKITVDGTPTGSSDKIYYRLLTDTAPKVAVVTTSDDCTLNSVPWKCPYEDASGDPIDVVEVFDTALTLALGGTGDSQIDEAFSAIRDEACGGDTCTSQEISTYIQNLETE